MRRSAYAQDRREARDGSRSDGPVSVVVRIWEWCLFALVGLALACTAVWASAVRSGAPAPGQHAEGTTPARPALASPRASEIPRLPGGGNQKDDTLVRNKPQEALRLPGYSNVRLPRHGNGGDREESETENATPAQNLPSNSNGNGPAGSEGTNVGSELPPGDTQVLPPDTQVRPSDLVGKWRGPWTGGNRTRTFTTEIKMGSNGNLEAQGTATGWRLDELFRVSLPTGNKVVLVGYKVIGPQGPQGYSLDTLSLEYQKDSSGSRLVGTFSDTIGKTGTVSLERTGN